MHEVEILFLLLAIVTALVLLSRRLAIPYPIPLVLGGLLIGFVPGVPPVKFDSEVIFLLFLPPLLYVTSLNTSWRDFKRNLRPILLLAIGLVLITAFAVAAAAHALLPGLPWSAAFVLGAVVAPTDAVATEAIAERMRLPGRVTSILQGESLVNDATAIVLFRIALAIVLGETFSMGKAAGSFFMVSAGGIAVGLAIGWVVGWLRTVLPQDPPVENTVSLLSPLAAYLPAEWLHVSGVLSVVACGIYLGRRGPRIVSSQTRLQAIAMWEMVTFLLNGLLFLMVGLQLRTIVQKLPSSTPLGALTVTALLISLTIIAVRLLWVFPLTYLPRLFPGVRRTEPLPSWQSVAVVAWSGMRGGISLAVALSIPQTLGSGASAQPFPFRGAILFVTFGVILVTLVAQGLSLPALIRALGVVGGDEEREEEAKARAEAVRAALDRLREFEDSSEIEAEVIDDIRRLYHLRSRNLSSPTEGDAPAPGPSSHLRVKTELVATERATIIALRDRGVIGDGVMHRIQADLDMEEVRIGSMREQQTLKS